MTAALLSCVCVCACVWVCVFMIARQDVYTSGLRARACYSPCFQLSTGVVVTGKQKGRTSQPHILIRATLCHCLCCFPSVCILHHRSDPPGDKRDTVR